MKSERHCVLQPLKVKWKLSDTIDTVGGKEPLNDF